MSKYLIYTFITLFAVVFSSCRKEEVGSVKDPVIELPVYPEEKVLLSYDHRGSFTREQVNERFNIPMISFATVYGIEVYSLTYKTTTFEGKVTEASGAVLFPVADSTFPLMSLQHGTIRNDLHAPSYYNKESESYTYGSMLASAGYVISMPDYLGYAVSKHLDHPYEHAATLASASADMLKAVQEFTAKKGIRLDKKLFLAGYSEGGYATMALHRLLEEKYPHRLEVTASAPGGGAYNKTAFAEHVLTSDTPLNFIHSYLWVLDTYNKKYNMNRVPSDFLNEPYATRVVKQGPFAEVSKIPARLFTPEFIEGILNGTDQQMLNAFQHNDIFDWKPKAPVALYHGVDDDYVPIFNAESAYKAMKDRGAIVDLYALPGDHFSSIPFYALAVFDHFSRYN